jgi:Glyoxalase-like domain
VPPPELDHVIVFLRGPHEVDAVRSLFDGLVLDEGVQHVGQGTRNRRIVFPDSYVELLWVDEPAAARRSGLRFTERCAGEACPYGVVLRGRLPERRGFVEYAVPAGPVLLVADDPRMPFLAVNEDPAALRPSRRFAGPLLNRAHEIERVEIAALAVPVGLEVPEVSFVQGDPSLALLITGLGREVRLSGRACGGSPRR